MLAAAERIADVSALKTGVRSVLIAKSTEAGMPVGSFRLVSGRISQLSLPVLDNHWRMLGKADCD